MGERERKRGYRLEEVRYLLPLAKWEGFGEGGVYFLKGQGTQVTDQARRL